MTIFLTKNGINFKGKEGVICISAPNTFSIPLIIFKGSDYETAESVLRKYNKKLKKLPLNGLMGRFVVNLE